MKKRFANILDTRKKRKGITALCAAVIIAGAAGTSVAYGAADNTVGAAIDNIANLSVGNSCSLIDDEFIISYGAESSAVVPLTADSDDETVYFKDKAIYISEEVTAVACGGQSDDDMGEAPFVRVLNSNDKGMTWNKYAVSDGEETGDRERFIGFSSKDNGWLMLVGDVAMGHQYNRIFQTSDGGKTWSQIGNTNDVYAHVGTGAGFADENIGFILFRYDTNINPVVYRTENKGKTWTFNETYNLALIWADS